MQPNRKALARGLSVVASCIPHTLIETIGDTVTGCGGCGHLSGRYV